jgi:hypothetical protein
MTSTLPNSPTIRRSSPFYARCQAAESPARVPPRAGGLETSGPSALRLTGALLLRGEQDAPLLDRRAGAAPSLHPTEEPPAVLRTRPFTHSYPGAEAKAKHHHAEVA